MSNPVTTIRLEKQPGAQIIVTEHLPRPDLNYTPSLPIGNTTVTVPAIEVLVVRPNHSTALYLTQQEAEQLGANLRAIGLKFLDDKEFDAC